MYYWVAFSENRYLVYIGISSKYKVFYSISLMLKRYATMLVLQNSLYIVYPNSDVRRIFSVFDTHDWKF